MGPFRDELAAAHATIARLEADIRELRATRDEPRLKVAWAKPGLTGWFVIAMVSVTAAVAALLFVAPRHRGADKSFRGIAVAPHDSIPPIVDNGNIPEPHAKAPALDSANPHADSKSSSKCNCSPGDPLCSCL